MEAGIEDAACEFHYRKIVVTRGEVVEGVFNNSQKYECDLIFLGTHEGFISFKIKNIMR